MAHLIFIKHKAHLIFSKHIANLIFNKHITHLIFSKHIANLIFNKHRDHLIFSQHIGHLYVIQELVLLIKNATNYICSCSDIISKNIKSSWMETNKIHKCYSPCLWPRFQPISLIGQPDQTTIIILYVILQLGWHSSNTGQIQDVHHCVIHRWKAVVFNILMMYVELWYCVYWDKYRQFNCNYFNFLPLKCLDLYKYTYQNSTHLTRMLKTSAFQWYITQCCTPSMRTAQPI